MARIFCCVALALSPHILSSKSTAEDVIYAGPIHVSVRAEAMQDAAGFFRSTPEELDLDVNHDGIADLQFRHSLIPRPEHIDAAGHRLMRFAEGGIESSLNTLRGLRAFAIQASDEGVYGERSLLRIQSQIDHGLNFMDGIAQWQHDGAAVLDGSLGLQATASNQDLIAVSATPETAPGTYEVKVTVAAERANVSAGTFQESGLAGDETLVLNDVAIPLHANMIQNQVIDRINDFSLQTGVFADNGGAGQTRLVARDFGVQSQIRVISNMAANSSSSGFGNTFESDTGVNAEVEIGDRVFSGQGAIVIVDDGPAKGLSFEILENPADQAQTSFGPFGQIVVVDNSPVFELNPETGKTVSFVLPNVATSALGLGLGLAENRYTALSEIKALSWAQAQDSLEIIEKASQELEGHHQEIRDFLALHSEPYGMSSLTGLNGSGFALQDVGLLPPGVEIGPDLNYQEADSLLQHSQLFRDIEQQGFIGVRIPDSEGWVYGWIGVEIDGDSSLTISDFAWHQNTNEPVVTGVASNRTADFLFPGDANLDGTVDFGDFLICSQNFGQSGTWQQGDFNQDRLVDFQDFLVLTSNYGIQANAITVPEPGALQLLGLMVVTLCTLRLFNKRNATSPNQSSSRLCKSGMLAAAGILLSSSWVRNSVAENVVYENPVDISVKGTVYESSDGLFRIFPHELDHDLNHDGVSDLRFRHSLTPRSQRISPGALRMMQQAESGVRESLEIVESFRTLAIDSAVEAVGDREALAANQAQIDNGLDTIDRIAKAHGEKGIPVLNGSFGKFGVASSSDVVWISATQQTEPDSYIIEVDTRAERAYVRASSSQSSPLAVDEAIVINGVAIELFAGMTQAQVIDRINEFHIRTGVVADRSGRSGETRLYSENFGTDASVCVASSVQPASDSAGFGLAEWCDFGVDLIATINGANSYSGSGDTVVATGGSEKGLTFRVRPDAANPVMTPAGFLGPVDVTDASPRFGIDNETGDTVQYSIPNVSTPALGVGAWSNQFKALNEIRVHTPSQANDSLQIIDRALNELRYHHDGILDFLGTYALPYGEASLEALNGAAYSVGEFGLLPGGIEVGRDLEFEKGNLHLQDSQVFRDLEQKGFVGARVPVQGGWIYGWIGVQIDGDSSLTISDFAWNLQTNQPVVTGVASSLGPDALLAGDADLDGNVGFSDFLICTNNFGQFGSWHQGDFNFDLVVDFNDFTLLSSNFGNSASAVGVPEPSGLLLACFVFLLFRPTKRHLKKSDREMYGDRIRLFF